VLVTISAFRGTHFGTQSIRLRFRVFAPDPLVSRLRCKQGQTLGERVGGACRPLLAVYPTLASTTPLQAEATQSRELIHFTIINMSGKSCEVHVRDTVVPLHVAERVALQVSLGESVKITSNTDRRVMRVITISANDEGHLLPVD
jgi:hypothetical protein